VLALRECVLCFAPYGFRATWHHLLAAGPALPAALDELEEARHHWLARSENYATERRRAKAAGNRTPPRVDPWHSRPGLIAYCPDWENHPTERLRVVVNRAIAAYEAGTVNGSTCRACTQELTHDAACRHCGVQPPHELHVRTAGSLAKTHRWRELWQRTTRPT
jgi:hypothetical protein